MNGLDHSQRVSAWRLTVLTCVAVIVVQLAFGWSERQLIGTTALVWIRGAHIALAVVVLLILAANRRNPSRALIIAAWLTVTLPLYIVVWKAQAVRSSAGLLWSLFIGEKICSLAVALFAPPPLWMGLSVIGGFMVEVVVQAWLLPKELTPTEPFTTLIVGVISAALLINRVRRLESEVQAARLAGELETLARVERIALAIRDLANTPLQTLELDTVLLRARGADVERLASRMERALGRLRMLRHALERYERQFSWQEDDASIDSLDVIEHGGAPPDGPRNVSRRASARANH